MKFIVYDLREFREGYEHVNHLCFVCATKEVSKLRLKETIHPRIAGHDLEECHYCGVPLNPLEL